jgi:hypothetical protein
MWRSIATALVLVSSSALAAEAPFLQGTFHLDMAQSKWGGGVNGAPGAPEAPGTSHITGGSWAFEKDDGAHRKGVLMQTLRDGRIQVFYYDTPYDGRMHWLNDWYQESNRRLDDHSFTTSWAVVKEGKTLYKGGPGTCRINEARDVITCDDAGLHEVYAKAATPPVLPPAIQ